MANGLIGEYLDLVDSYIRDHPGAPPRAWLMSERSLMKLQYEADGAHALELARRQLFTLPIYIYSEGEIDVGTQLLSRLAADRRAVGPLPIRPGGHDQVRMTLMRLALASQEVMNLLSAEGPRIVPHLIDDDENPGQRLRDLIKKAFDVLA